MSGWEKSWPFAVNRAFLVVFPLSAGKTAFSSGERKTGIARDVLHLKRKKALAFLH